MAISAATEIEMATRDGGTDVLERPDVVEKTKGKSEPRKASMYKVLIHNDNVTPMEYVVGLLVDVFNKTTQEAVDLTMAVHQQGTGVTGVFTKAVAQAKLEEAEAHKASWNPHPIEVMLGYPERITLRLTMEKD